MKIVKPTATVEGKITDYLGLERAIRVCYKSEDKISQGSAEKLLKHIIQRGHFSCLEHIRIILQVPKKTYETLKDLDWSEHPVIHDARYVEKTEHNFKYIVSGNIRAFRDLYAAFEDELEIRELVFRIQEEYPLLFDDVQIIYDTSSPFYQQIKVLDPEELSEEERIRHDWQTVRFVVDRGISLESLRHRTMSDEEPGYFFDQVEEQFKSGLQESTRYCDYSGEVEFIDISQGALLDASVQRMNDEERCTFYNEWLCAMAQSEVSYRKLRRMGVSPQLARDVLPLSTKTELILTAPMYIWREFFRQRLAKGAHPQMREVVVPLYDNDVWELIKE